MALKTFSAMTLAALLAAQVSTPAHAQRTGRSAQPSGPVAGAQAAATPASTATGSDSASALTEGYVVGVGDIVEVSVLGREDYRARVQVQVDGTIQLPLIKDIKASDRTVLQLRNDIRRALISGQYFNDPAVSVVVAGYSSRNVTILGEIVNPGIVPVDRSYRLSEIIARAGGLKETASSEITLTRENGERQSYDLKKIATGSDQDDPIVNPNDRIFIDKLAEVYVTGQVNSPGVQALRGVTTLRVAIARAGGVNAQGSMKRVKVYRDGKRIKDFSLDDAIQPGDSIEVGERLF